ncbi:MAG: replication-relaxation family protein [Bdellovibrionota bacterium]
MRGRQTRITERDSRILRGCYENGVLSFSQIRRRYFEGRANSTLCNRLSRLKGIGLLRSYRMGQVLYQGSPQAIGTVYEISKAGIRTLEQIDPKTNYREEPIPINHAALTHDLLLSDVSEAFKRRWSGAEITNGKLLKSSGLIGARLPDAVLEVPDAPGKIAVELELTAKSERRYREIILGYRLSQDYPLVLYVTGKDPIREKIEATLDQKRIPGLPKGSTGKFYFADLNSLIADPCRARMDNGVSEFPVPQQRTNNQTKGEQTI